MKESRTYPLRLPGSLKAAEKLSREDWTSINQFVATGCRKSFGARDRAVFYGPESAGQFQNVR